MTLRLALLPAAGALCAFGLRAVGAFEPPDKMLMLLLQHSMPSALNVYAMAAVTRCNADEVATMLFWQYLAAIVTIPTCGCDDDRCLEFAGINGGAMEAACLL
jgi:predicted permease